MLKGSRGSIRRGSISEIPGAIGDRAHGTIDESDRQRLEAVCRVCAEARAWYRSSNASDWIGAGSCVTTRKVYQVSEMSGAQGCKANYQIGRTQTRKIEGSA